MLVQRPDNCEENADDSENQQRHGEQDAQQIEVRLKSSRTARSPVIAHADSQRVHAQHKQKDEKKVYRQAHCGSRLSSS